MAKYSVPGIRFTEIDNTIQTETEAGMGIGAIVLKSNKGPVNQRVVTKNYGEFTNIFGEPENITDYGHFAAENYFANSTQLFAVRCTMGDEQYAQIQFTYPEASVSARNAEAGVSVFKYVDNQTDNQLQILQPLVNLDVDVDALTSIHWTRKNELDPYILDQKARYAEFTNIMSETTDLVVYKAWNGTFENNTDIENGVHVTYPSKVDSTGTMLVTENKLIFNTSGWSSSADHASVALGNPITATPIDGSTEEFTYAQVKITVPENLTLYGQQTNVSFYGNWDVVSAWGDINNGTQTIVGSGIAYKDIFKSENFYDPQGILPKGDWTDGNVKDLYGYTDAYKINVTDWEDPTTRKEYYIDRYQMIDGEMISFNSDIYDNQKAVSLYYTEFGNVDETYAIIGTNKDMDPIKTGTQPYYAESISDMYKDSSTAELFPGEGETKRQILNRMMSENSISDISEITQFTYLRYYQILPVPTIIELFVKETPKQLDKQMNEWLFHYIADKASEKPVVIAVYDNSDPEDAIQPITTAFKNEAGVQTNNIVATPTSYLVNSVDKTYADGYTLLTQSEDEPGNGDIEGYNSVFDNQLIIASMGPGEYGNDIGVSIITAECADIKALQHQNAFNWKYSYDDEDLVNKDADNLTWKKVFRINVYIKNKSQTALGAWGTGMDALLKDPAESWFVSTDPYAKDAEGNSLYAPTVINGHSDYIYVSRTSVSKALNCKGAYEQPIQTYSIYPLTGGANSTKNNISEKTAALNFYRDRQKAKFDILFNVDAIDTFNGRQRYNAHQRKIAEIAGNRTMDIGVVQVTSKSAKTCKQMLSESKMFTFNNASYVAEYAGYDKYYNSTLASWIYLPKSVAGACAMAYCDTFSYPWMAPAGVARGTISYTAGQLLRLSDDEIGQLYDNNVNSTRDCGGYGTVLWGQKTALKKNSLLNRINIRRCLNYIEKQLENMMTPYLFMQNSVNTRSSARNDIDSFLQRVQAAEGLDSFSLSVTQDPEDPTIMNVNITLQPTSAIEFIDVKVVINRNRGVTVDEG